MTTEAPSATILLVDEPEKAQAVQHWLERQGYTIELAKDSAGAITTIQVMMPDLVLINMHLPSDKALDICRYVKADMRLGFIPVIAMLNAADGGIEAAFIAGADDVLVQPIQQNEMLTRVGVLLRIKQRLDMLWTQNQVLTDKLAERTHELEIALRESKEVAVLKDSIVRNVSHELKTPLLQVKSSVAMLAEDARAANQGTSVLADHATAATARLESVVLNITQLAASLTMKFEPFRLDEAVNQATRQLTRQWASSGGVDRIRSAVENCPMLLGDRSGIAQVLQQLLDNAIKFSPNGGPIQISTEFKNRTVRISVTDQGIGIPDDQVERVFQAFYQVDSSSTRPFGGTGVGLAIVKLLLDTMGTTISVQSQPAVGSTFSFSLPIAEGELITWTPDQQPAFLPPVQAEVVTLQPAPSQPVQSQPVSAQASTPEVVRKPAVRKPAKRKPAAKKLPAKRQTIAKPPST